MQFTACTVVSIKHFDYTKMLVVRWRFDKEKAPSDKSFNLILFAYVLRKAGCQ